MGVPYYGNAAHQTLSSAIIDSISDGVYLSNERSVTSHEGRKRMKELQIQRVLTVMERPIDPRDTLRGVKYLHLPLEDGMGEDLLGSGAMQRGLDFIQAAVEKNIPCLVHCRNGVSRSVTMVAAYLMKQREMKAQAAIEYIQERRSDHLRRNAPPNPSFRKQLEVFEQLGYKCHPHQIRNSDAYKKLKAELIENKQPSDKNTAGRRKPIVCFGCGEAGHAFRHCPKNTRRGG